MDLETFQSYGLPGLVAGGGLAALHADQARLSCPHRSASEAVRKIREEQFAEIEGNLTEGQCRSILNQTHCGHSVATGMSLRPSSSSIHWEWVTAERCLRKHSKRLDRSDRPLGLCLVA
jgi:hypothetical protein